MNRNKNIYCVINTTIYWYFFPSPLIFKNIYNKIMKYSIWPLFQVVLHTERPWKMDLILKVKLPSWYQLRKVKTTLTVSGNGITDVTERCMSKWGKVQPCTYVRHIWVQSWPLHTYIHIHNCIWYISTQGRAGHTSTFWTCIGIFPYMQHICISYVWSRWEARHVDHGFAPLNPQKYI